MGSEGFVDTEDEAGGAAAYTEIEAHVGIFLEFPAVAYAYVGQNVAPAQFIGMVKYGGSSGPEHYAVASEEVLAQFDGQVGLALVAVASD